jgi:2-desacetyl-2-hydroxyethyl bacteriochlorophyllide A dehydrogenase
MKAVVLRGADLLLEDVAQPAPGPQEVLAQVRACGICGSDLHAVQEAARGANRLEGVVMGHEFVAEVVAAGAGAERWTAGTRVVCSPTIPIPGRLPPEFERQPAGAEPVPLNYHLAARSRTVGYSHQYPGGYGEYVVLPAPLLVRVPEHVSDRAAATTEPCAVALHAVRAGRVEPDEPVLVMGAGPIGAFCLLWLKRNGVKRVVVSEPAAPRRALAQKLGADVVLDPTAGDASARLAAEGGSPAVVFDAVGARGTLQQAIDFVASEGQVVVVGVNPGEDAVRPRVAIGKELNVRFALAYTAAEIAEALAAIADGSIDPLPLVSRTVALPELPAAVAALADPHDCKILVEYA